MKVVAVYSTKGGVGKTTAAVNLAWEASLHHRVLLWDLDPQGASTFLLDVKPKLRDGVESLLDGDTTARRAIRATAYADLDVLPADDSYRELEVLLGAAKKSARQVARVLERVASEYDVVVLDCPPGASLVAQNAVYGADVVVVPLVPSPLSLRSLEQVLALVAESARSAPVLAFLSMVDRRKSAHRVAVETLAVERTEVLDLVVPATVVLERMGAERAPVAVFAAHSEAARAYRMLWAEVRYAAGISTTPRQAKAKPKKK
jgi:chromosome partitioning protein